MKEFPLNLQDHLEYFKLLRRIDLGEYKLMTQKEDYDGLDSIYFTVGFDLEDNYGIVTAFKFNQAMRLQISFDKDLNERQAIYLVTFIKDFMEEKNCHNLSIWCNNANKNMVSILSQNFSFEEPVYKNYELTYDYRNFKEMALGPLKSYIFQENHLHDVLDLLELSFKNICKKGEFIENPRYYLDKFQAQGKATCEVYFLEDRLIGMYFQNDGELEYIGILPEYQGQGYGKVILNRALKAIQSLSDQKPFLYCVESNKDALRFYLKTAWQISGQAAWLRLK